MARAAAAALSGRPTARAQGALARALEHPHETVRRAAAASLARVAGEPVPSEGSGPALRAASRRITARLAAMDGAALREAVLASAADGPQQLAPAATATRAVPLPLRQAQGERKLDTARGEPVEPRAVPAAALALGLSLAGSPAVARAATAVLVEDAPPPPPEASGLESAVLFEVRAALRGSSPDDLAAAVGAPAAAVSAALSSLRDRGTLVQRGARWFMA